MTKRKRRERIRELIYALEHCVEVLDEDGCDCGPCDPPCALCEGRHALERAKELTRQSN